MLLRWRRPSGSNRSSRRKQFATRPRLRVEQLETRTLLSLSGLEDLWAEPARAFLAPGPVGYTPAQVRQAYGFDRIDFGNGVRGDGSGQTIAIVTAYDNPTLEGDLRAFNRAFNLPDVPRLTKVNQFGGRSAPRYNPQWALETALDAQWAHAIAPGANILVVQANSARLSDLLTAVDYARQQPGVVTVSMSWGLKEFAGQSLLNRFFTTPAGHVDGAGLPGGVTFVAASGDSGRPSWPATSSNVVAVGGSRLSIHTSGTYAGEVAWRGSGGGVSAYESRPEYQEGLASEGGRAVPDVSYGADPATGFAVYATLPGLGAGWFMVGGTSAGAPQWAGLVAIAAQGRNLLGLPALEGGPEALYDLSDAAFRDIVVGAGVGYDLVTGRGSPRAEQIIAGLLGTADGGAPVGPSAPIDTVNEPPAETPAIDAGNLALIMQALSDVANSADRNAVIPVTPGRLADVPPPVPPPVMLPPAPSLSVIHYKVGGGVAPEELSEMPQAEPPAKPAAPVVPPESRSPEQGGVAAAVFEAVPPAPAVGEPARPEAAAVTPPANEEARGGTFRWLAAAGLAILLGGLWTGRVVERRWHRSVPLAAE